MCRLMLLGFGWGGGFGDVLSEKEGEEGGGSNLDV